MKPHFTLSKSKLLEQVKTLEDLNLKISYSYKTNREVGKLLQELFPSQQDDEIAAQNTRTESSPNSRLPK